MNKAALMGGLLADRSRNKSTSFTEDERNHYGLHGSVWPARKRRASVAAVGGVDPAATLPIMLDEATLVTRIEESCWYPRC